MKFKKLALNKSTVQKLDVASLKQIKGGAAAPAKAAPTPTAFGQDTCVLCGPHTLGCTNQ